MKFPQALAAALLLTAGAAAHALPVTATLTADNYYGLYTGKSNGNDLAFIGRNELTDVSVPASGFAWSKAETWSFNVGAGDYAYVVVRDGGGPQMWIGDFKYGSSELVSNTSSWEYVVVPNLTTWSQSGTPPVTLGNLDTLIDAANLANSWANPTAQANNPSSPWGTITGVDSDAKFLWHDTLGSTSSSDSGYVIFRSKAPFQAVPEPGSLALVGLALFGAAAVRRRSQRAA